MDVVFAGDDTEGLVSALREAGAEVRTVAGIANRPALEEAGVSEADVFVLADAAQATAIVVARDLNPDLRVVAYTGESLPEFVSAQRVLSVDPDLLDPDAVAEELVDGR
jgi:hypothetical protein